jgi:hypothetical protein
MPTRLVVDCATGKATDVQLTAGEVAQRDADQASEVARQASLAALQPDYGSDSSTADQIKNAVTALRAYLALASPTPAQTVDAIKVLVRVALFVLRRVGP